MNNTKKYGSLAIALLFCSSLFAQKYFTKQGEISFFSDAAMEKIEAHNKRATAIVDTETGDVQFAVLVKNFLFEKALMQEHFNENYMESDKYPKATFRGKILDQEGVDFSTPGTFTVKVNGTMEIHGVEQEVSAPATFIVAENAVDATSTFVIACADYGIKIPGVVADNIAKEIEIKVDVSLQPYRK